MTRTQAKVSPIDSLPDTVEQEFVYKCQKAFNEFSHRNPAHMRKYCCKDVVIDIVKRTSAIVSKENTMLEVC